MIECELNIYNTKDDLYNNLIPKKGKKHTNDLYSSKREDLITQMLIDKLHLELNKDQRFEAGRKVNFYEISFFGQDDKDKNKTKLIQEKKILKKGSSQEEIFIVNGIDYTIKLEMYNTRVTRKKTQEEIEDSNNKKEDTKTLVTEKSTQKSKSQSENKFSTSDTQNENNDSFYRRLKDDYKGMHYIMTITYTNHEVDGNVITLEDIDIKNKFGEILFYPKDDNSKIKKDSKILIEVKQNATLKEIFDQMKKLMEDFRILLPNEQFYYFGFVNEGNAKSNLNENEFIEIIQKTEIQNPNFKIFLFTLKDNKIFDFDLKDNADYSVHFRNEIKNEIEIMKNEMDTKINTKINGLKEDMDTKINGLKKDMDTKINGLKDDVNKQINGLKEDMDTKINGLKKDMDTNINGLKDDVNKQINGLKGEMNNLKDNMAAQFKSLSDMIRGLIKNNDINEQNQEQNKK